MSSQVEAKELNPEACPFSNDESSNASYLERIFQALHLGPEERERLIKEIGLRLYLLSRWLPQKLPSREDVAWVPPVLGSVFPIVTPVLIKVLSSPAHIEEVVAGQTSETWPDQNSPTCRGHPVGTEVGFMASDGRPRFGRVEENSDGVLFINYAAGLYGMIRNVAYCDDEERVLSIWEEPEPNIVDQVQATLLGQEQPQPQSQSQPQSQPQPENPSTLQEEASSSTQTIPAPSSSRESTNKAIPKPLTETKPLIETEPPAPPEVVIYLPKNIKEVGHLVITNKETVTITSVASSGSKTLQVREGSLVVCKKTTNCELHLPKGIKVLVIASAKSCNSVGCTEGSTQRIFLRDQTPPQIKIGRLNIKQGHISLRTEAVDGSQIVTFKITISHQDGESITINALNLDKGAVQVPIINFGRHEITGQAVDVLGNKTGKVNLGVVDYPPMRLTILDHQEKENGEVDFTVELNDPTDSANPQSPRFGIKKEAGFPPGIAKWVVGQLNQILKGEKRGCQTLEKTAQGSIYKLSCRLDDSHGEIKIWWAKLKDVAGRPVPGSSGSAKIILSEKDWQLKILDGTANLTFLILIISAASTLAVGGPGLWYYQKRLKPQLPERRRRRQAIDKAWKALNNGDFETAWQHLESVPKDFWPGKQEAITSRCFKLGITKAQLAVADGDHQRARDILDRLSRSRDLSETTKFLIQALYQECNQLARKEHLKRGNHFAQRRDWQGAILEYEFAIGLDPEHPDVEQIKLLLQKARIEFARKKYWDQAEELINKAEYRKAWQVLRKGGVPEKEIRAHVGNHALAKVRRLVAQGNYQQARKILRQLPADFQTEERIDLFKQCDGLEITDCLKKGGSAMVRKDWQKAVDYFTRALVLDKSLGEDNDFMEKLDEATIQLKKERAMKKAKTAASNMAFDVAIDLLEKAGFSREEIKDFVFEHAKDLIKHDKVELAFDLSNQYPLKGTSEGVIIANQTRHQATSARLEREKQGLLAKLEQEPEEIADPALRELRAFLLQDHYDVLGVSRQASDAEIEHAYKERQIRLHPDLTQAKIFKEGDYRQAAINELMLERCQRAYEILSVPRRRAHYNKKMGYL